MNRRLIIGAAFGVLCFLELGPVQHAASLGPAAARLTLAPAGPFHVSGNQILDSKGREFLIRGTQIAPFQLATVARDNRAGLDYGAHSATTLSAIRLRFNLNAVRLPVDLGESVKAGYFSALAKVVQRSNQMDLLVILAPRDLDTRPDRLPHFAAYFKGYANVMFEVSSEAATPNVADLVHAIRSAGASQPVIVPTGNGGRLFEGGTPVLDDPNVVYTAAPRYSGAQTDAERDSHFGFLAHTVPVLANGWAPELDNAEACAAVPSDPTAASDVVQSYLNYFDAHAISWTVSSFEPGKLINDFSLHDATSLENGWTCGKPGPVPAGIGRIIQAHMRGSVERELFVVSGAGGVEIGRGAFALAYGPVMADHDAIWHGLQPPMKLSGISIQITDAAGVTRPAGILSATEGWGQTNFVVPDQSAVGPARMTVVREDGSRTSTNIVIADTAPGFVTGHSCRGPAIGTATETLADGRTVNSQISSCSKGFDCRTIEIPVAVGAKTQVRISGSGFRHATSAAAIEMRIGGVRVPVVSFGPTGNPGEDQVTIEIPARLYGIGETDLICHLNGRLSNATRIRIGAAKPVS